MKLFYLIMLIALIPILVNAQNNKPIVKKSNKKDIHHNSSQFIALFVTNFDSTLSWYQNRLGFKVYSQGENKSLGAKFAIIRWNGVTIEMIQHLKVVSREEVKAVKSDNIGTQGFFKPGIYVEDLESLQSHLKGKGVNIKYPLIKNENLRMNLFIIEDREGNLLQFFNSY